MTIKSELSSSASTFRAPKVQEKRVPMPPEDAPPPQAEGTGRGTINAEGGCKKGTTPQKEESSRRNQIHAKGLYNNATLHPLQKKFSKN